MSNINLNVNPYFDDYDETKNYYKILFKPGVALQARELTQVQSILQNQISKIGSYLFKDGTSLSGTDTSTISINYDVRTIRLKPTDNLNSPIDVTNFFGKWVLGTNTQIIGEVKFVFREDEPDIGDSPSITIALTRFTDYGFFEDDEILNFYDTRSDALLGGTPKYTAVIQQSQKNYFLCTNQAYSDELQVEGSTAALRVGDYVIYNNIPLDTVIVQVKNLNTVILSRQIPFSIFNERVEFNRKSSTHSLIVNVDSGTYYKNGTFITNTPQSVVPAKYTAYPTASVGFRLKQTIVNSSEDTSLLDPALGSSNYFAEGSDRLRYELILEKINLINDNTSVTQKPNISETYMELIRFNQGKRDILVNTSVKSSLRQELAKRTYDESGNYIVTPFNINLIPTSNNSTQFRFDINPGTAYIGGYEVTTIAPTPLYLNRALEEGSEISFNVSTAYGNYVLINSISKKLLDENYLGANAILEAHTVHNPTSTATRVGYLAFKNLSYESGTEANAVYRMHSYFFYPDKTNNLSINNTNSFVLVNNSLNPGITATYNVPLFKANVAADGFSSSGNIKIFENKIDRMIFPISRAYIKNVTRISTQYNKTFTNIQFTGGIGTLTLNAPESFTGADGALTTSEKRSNFTMLVKTQGGTTSQGFLPVDTSSVAIVLSNQAKIATITLTDTAFNGTMDIVATIDNDDTQIRTKTLANITATKLNITVSDIDYYVNKADIRQFYKIAKIGSNSYIGAYSSSTNYVTNNVVVDENTGKFYIALQNSNNSPLYDSAYWYPLSEESTLNYYLSNGQKDNMYDYGSVRWLPETGAPGNVVISYNYYTHSGTGPIVADSYPSYDDIYNFTSPLDFSTIVLRDALDFRPRRADNISNSMVFENAIKPNPRFLTEVDISYYKPRYDRLYITNQETDLSTRGQRFFIDYGIPSLTPKLPPDKTDKDIQLLYNIYVTPYTSNIYLNKFEKNSIDRYTMKNIGDMDKRLLDVEKKVRKQGLEIQAINSRITDPNGVELFKTGIFIEDFKDYTKADIGNPNFKAIIDTTNEEGRPPQTSKIVPLDFRSLNRMQQAERILQMEKESDEVMLSFLNPTNTINANPGGIAPGPITIIKNGTTPGYVSPGIEPSLLASDAFTLLNAAYNNRSGLIRNAPAPDTIGYYAGDSADINYGYLRDGPRIGYLTSNFSNGGLPYLSKYSTIITLNYGNPYGFRRVNVYDASGELPQTVLLQDISGNPNASQVQVYASHVLSPAKDITSMYTEWNQASINRGTWVFHMVMPGRWGVSKFYKLQNATLADSAFRFPLTKDRFRVSAFATGWKGSEGYTIYDNLQQVYTKHRWYNAGQSMISWNLSGVDLGGGFYWQNSYTYITLFGLSVEFFRLPEYASGGEPPAPAFQYFNFTDTNESPPSPPPDSTF